MTHRPDLRVNSPKSKALAWRAASMNLTLYSGSSEAVVADMMKEAVMVEAYTDSRSEREERREGERMALAGVEC